MGKKSKKLPKEVGIAIKLLYIKLGLMIVYNIIELIFGVESSLTLNTKIIQIIFLFAYFLIWLFFIYMTQMGNNWARISILILFIISIPSFLFGMLLTSFFNNFYLIVSFIQLILHLIALVFLFRKKVNNWFKSMSN